MGTFTYRATDNPAITRGGFYLTTTNYINGTPSSNGTVYAESILGTASQFNLIPYMPGYGTFETSDNGNFDVGDPLVGFHPTTSLLAQLRFKFATLDAGDYIIFQNMGLPGINNYLGPKVGTPSDLNSINISLPNYRNYSLLITDPYQVQICSNPSTVFFPISPFAPGFETSADWGFFIFGNYDIISTSWLLINLTHPSLGKKALPGDLMKLYADPDNYDFTTVDTVMLNNTPVTTFVEHTSHYITFRIPLRFPPTPKIPIGIKNPTEFTGTAHVDMWTILLASASGIYTITPNKTSDTLYLDSGEGNLTEDIAIPDPTIKTGFIGG